VAPLTPDPNMVKQAAKTLSQLQSALTWAKDMTADKQKRRAFAREEFHKADADKSGTLDKAEILKVLEDVAHAFHLDLPKKEKILALYDMCDKNGDGVLQEGEFLVFFKDVLVSYVHHAEVELSQREHIIKEVGGAKNGQTRSVAIVKPPKFYPADDIPALASTGKTGKRNPAREAASGGVAKLRSSIKPGTVLILLSGRFRGRRVVFLKQLMGTGLLLVTGPYCCNGIPLRRVNQAYCIATSTVVDVSGVDVKKFSDQYFAKPKGPKRVKKTGDEMMTDEEKAPTGPSAERQADQKALDDTLMKAIKKTPMMDKYLKARFSLSKAQMPHKMKF